MSSGRHRYVRRLNHIVTHGVQAERVNANVNAALDIRRRQVKPWSFDNTCDFEMSYYKDALCP